MSILATPPTHDLDELVHQARDPESRLLFAEAVQAYRSGALRAAVTSTWIAVVYDVLSKIRELGVDGDKNARSHSAKLETAVAAGDIPTLQRIEAAILETATKEFELLSSQERVDLERLQADRNLCAHPALQPDHTLFRPTPELVRMHLVHAGLHLFRHPPVQGKSALERIIVEMSRASFPEDPERVHQVLCERLGRAKEALVRNLTALLLKTLFLGATPELAGRLTVVVGALVAISRTHGAVYEREVKAYLAKWPEGLGDEQLVTVFRLAGADPRCWSWLSNASRIRALQFIGKHSANDLAKAGVFDALTVPDVRTVLLDRFSALDEYEKQSVIAENPRPEFAEEAIGLFSQAGSYRGAESLGHGLILPMAPHFSVEQLGRILRAAQENGQIWDASGSAAIFNSLLALTSDRFDKTKDEWQQFAAFITVNKRADWYGPLLSRLAAKGVLATPTFDGIPS